MFRKYAKPGATSLDKDQFIAVCQDLCSGLAKNVTKCARDKPSLTRAPAVPSSRRFVEK